MCDLYFRLCANGQNVKQVKYFDHSHSPTVSLSGLRIMVALLEAFCVTLSKLDVDNSFQNTIQEETK